MRNIAQVLIGVDQNLIDFNIDTAHLVKMGGHVNASDTIHAVLDRVHTQDM
jgi:hypothetical protein